MAPIKGRCVFSVRLASIPPAMCFYGLVVCSNLFSATHAFLNSGFPTSAKDTIIDNGQITEEHSRAKIYILSLPLG